MQTQLQKLQNPVVGNHGSTCVHKVGNNFESHNDVEKINKGFQYIRELQRVSRELSKSKTIRNCNTFPVNSTASIYWEPGKGNSNITGMNQCRNKVFCPRCSWWAAMENQRVINLVEGHVLSNGGTGIFLTATIPHHAKSDFRTLNKQINKCWTKLMNKSRFHKKLVGLHGSKDLIWARGYDCTEGKNGFHPHFHVGLYLSNQVSTQEFAELKMLFLWCWNKAVEKIIGKQSSSKSLDFQRIKTAGKIAQYFNKVSIEISSNHNKEGFGKSIWQMMEAYSQTSDIELKKTYKKKINMFEKGTRKLRSMTFSKGFKELAKKLVDEEQDEEQLEEQSSNREKLTDIRNDLMKLIHKRRDVIRLHQMIDCYAVGDTKAEPAFISFMRLCDKYSLENDLYDDDQMLKDYNGFIYQLNLWEQSKELPDLFSKLFKDELHFPS